MHFPPVVRAVTNNPYLFPFLELTCRGNNGDLLFVECFPPPLSNACTRPENRVLSKRSNGVLFMLPGNCEPVVS